MNISKRNLTIAISVGVVAAFVLGFSPAMWELTHGSKKNVYPSAPISNSTPTPTPAPTTFPTATPNVSPLSITDILEASRAGKDNLSRYAPLDTRTIILAGDVMLGRSVGFNMTRRQDFQYPVSQISDILKSADLSLVNLENPILENCPLTSEGMIFCSTPATLQTLQSAGIDMVNLANNHTLNYGNKGLDETIVHLQSAGIAHTGLSQEPASSYVIRDQRIGVVGFSMFGGAKLAAADMQTIKEKITEAHANYDFVIASFHWGSEYTDQPSIGQRLLAYQAIDAGADVVFGHHPHWIQGMELYQDKPIFYSLGNLIFDQDWSQETRKGMVIQLGLYKNQLASIIARPVFMADFSQPIWETVGYGNTTLEKFEKLSQALQQSQSNIIQLYTQGQ